ncbi:MAG TPA: long-chain fatty acid--CoA ligase [Azospirillaceae bacterium]|nr:long-chain fatty acid--CoA ligase [Azospirillaceae bacterium]
MHGLMMDMPLMISAIMEHARHNFPRREIVTRTVEGPIHRYTYADAYERIGQLANALTALGVKPGDRVGTLAWNTHRHFEMYYAVSGLGAVLHTVNPRLFQDQIVYIIRHAGDRFLFTDLTFVPLLEALQDHLPEVEGYVVMTDRAHMPATRLRNAMCYEELLEAQPAAWKRPEFDERTASSLCYTSGTTGNPKGVLYSHRSTVLHALGVLACGPNHLHEGDVTMPIVPLFHANAWGVAYMAPIAGAKIVFPGMRYDGNMLYELMEQEGVTTSAGVPTVWFGLLGYMRQHSLRFSTVKRIGIGGSAAPPAMLREFIETYGVEPFQGWGMTELSPVGTQGALPFDLRGAPIDEQVAYKSRQGRALFGVRLKAVDAGGREIPHDGKAFGELLCRGYWVASGYFRDDEATRAAMTADGWFRTGDVASFTPDNVMSLVDRFKDVIKSGGEWISSIDLENAAVGHPKIAEAAVVGVPHPKWDERPVLVCVPAPGEPPTADEILAYLRGRVAKWWLPDAVYFVPELPHTATGKIMKSKLREQYRDVLSAAAE